VFHTRCLRQSFLAGICILGFCLCLCLLYIPACNHSLPLGSCFKPGFLGFVGRDFSSLFTPTAFGLCFSPLGVKFISGALLVMFVSSLVCTPLGICSYGLKWKKTALCSKKKKSGSGTHDQDEYGSGCITISKKFL
jgi:hypothetical protein